MSKERLEEIIHKEAYLEGTNNLVMVINTDDYKWLIKQAERVRELENVNRVLKKSSEGSEIAKERLRNWIDELEIENERYREALEEIASKRMTYADMNSAIRTAKEVLEGEE